jgi:hypothetical protein
VNVPPGKTFTIHLDYTINETRLVKINISNIYTEFKVNICFNILNLFRI